MKREYSPDNTIQEWMNEIVAWGETKGWNDPDKPFAEWIALLHTEASEAYEEWRNGHDATEIYFNSAHGPVKSEIPMFHTLQGHKPEGIPIELADLAIRLFHMCALLDINLTDAIKMKMEYNETRAFRHGGKRS